MDYFEELDNATDGTSIGVPIKDKNGRNILAAILTYTFVVDPTGRVEIDDAAPAPRMVDECNGDDPAKSSIKKPSMLFEHKPGTDVILVGHAHPPLRGSVDHVDVSLTAGPITKKVRAYGLRAWKAASISGVVPGPARPLREPVPLIYELAWGGYDDSDPAKIVAEPRNYVGRGVARRPKDLVGQPAAQLEDPARPIGEGSNTPACFGAIHRHWLPRASFAGTYDEAWAETKMPLLPDDFDPRFHVAVPPEQWSPAALRGDEPIEVRGATPEGVWRFRLPRVTPGFSSFVQGKRTEHRTHLDTILIDADLGRVELTWRAAIPLPRKFEMLNQVVVFEKTLV